jgi:hypothetical protein
MGTSPPSGHAGLVTDSPGRGGGGPPGAAPPPAGACAITTAQDEIRAIPESNARCVVLIRIFSSDDFSVPTTLDDIMSFLVTLFVPNVAHALLRNG